MDISRVIHGGETLGWQARNGFLPKSQEQVEQPKHLSEQETKALVDELNRSVYGKSHIKYDYHEKLGKYYVTIVDGNTEEVVREIPPRKILDLVASIQEKLGLIVDQRI